MGVGHLLWVRDHTKLDVWRKACDLVVHVYEVSDGFPSDERFRLVSQMRRSAISVPSNIAEGASRRSQKEFVRYLAIAAGSSGELDTQLHIAGNLGLLKAESVTEARARVAEVRRMLVGLQRKIRSDSHKRP